MYAIGNSGFWILDSGCTQLEILEILPPPPVAGSTFPDPPKVCTLLHPPPPPRKRKDQIFTRKRTAMNVIDRMFSDFFQTVPRLRILL